MLPHHYIFFFSFHRVINLLREYKNKIKHNTDEKLIEDEAIAASNVILEYIQSVNKLKKRYNLDETEDEDSEDTMDNKDTRDIKGKRKKKRDSSDSDVFMPSQPFVSKLKLK